MKIVSWNCQEGFISREKYSKLSSLNPDIAVVQECLHPNEFNNKLKHHDVIWQGKSKSKGLCVLSFNHDIKLELLEQEDTYQWILPIKVSGKQNFILLAYG